MAAAEISFEKQQVRIQENQEVLGRKDLRRARMGLAGGH